MAGDMPGVDDENEAEKPPIDSALNAAVAAAQDQSESHETPTTVGDVEVDLGGESDVVNEDDGLVLG
jgi:hypothetical protein